MKVGSKMDKCKELPLGGIEKSLSVQQCKYCGFSSRYWPMVKACKE